jgi:predicted RNA-binding Zn-ribbon protein involved in translation (DUF1610 family)
MKPTMLIIGPGSAGLNYSIEPVTERVFITCPACGATVIAKGTHGECMTSGMLHEADCAWFARLECSASVTRRDASDGSIH